MKSIKSAATSKQLGGAVTVIDTEGRAPAITKSLTLAAREIARMEAAAAIHAEANGQRGFQAVSSKDGFSAVIKHGRTLIEISGDDFAVRQTD